MIIDMPIRIYADFNAQTEDGKIRLTTVGSLAAIDKLNVPLSADMKVVLHDEELEVEARLEHFPDGKDWLGVPDWSTKRYL
jgi:hypothetical protein